MASTWATKPAGTADLTGQQFGSIVVVRVASSQPLKWVVRCLKPYCNSEWVERHEKIVNGAMRCRNLACDLGRLEAPKVSRYEQDLNRVEPEKQPVPTPVPVKQVVQASQPNAEYSRYVTHAIRYWNPAEIVSWTQWQEIGERGHNWLLSKVEEDLKHARA